MIARLHRPVVLIPVLSVLFAAGMVAFTVADDTPATTKSSTAPAEAPELLATTKPAEVTPAAAPLLEKVSKAYADLKSLDLAGTLAGDFDVDGQKENQKIAMTGVFTAPNQFRHALADDLVVGSTGEQLYVYEAGRKIFSQVEAKKQRTRTNDLPDPFGHLLIEQSLSMALAVSSDAAAELKSLYEKIDKAADVTIDGESFAALSMSNPQERVTLAIDPQTNLIRRATIDLTGMFKQRGAADVKQAVLTMDYPTATPNGATKPEQFAWTPPPGARDAAEMQSGGQESPALALVGKPASDFTLSDINGKEWKFSDLKGSVLVFDFWATWCPPCVAAMPGLNEMAGELRDKGVKIVTINAADEDKELVSGFINSRSLKNLIVLMDPASKVSEQYKGTELLPTTMVIGKDGTIRKVITTLGSEGERDLRAAVEEALNASK